jgi:mannose-P-dolichol utilization defect protein 1
MEQCITELLKFNLKKECITLIISKLLGYAIILVSLNFKVPQIRNMLNSKSAEGLSGFSMYVETFIFLLTILYNIHYGNPLSTYGENIIILSQNLIILFLFWKYTQRKVPIYERVFVLSCYTLFCYIMLQPYIPEAFWGYLGSISVVLLSVSRFSQIYTSFITKSTGPLSLFTFVTALLGNLARAFTTYTETKDNLQLFTYCYGATLALIVLVQIIIYKPKDKHTKVEKQD